MAPKDLLFTFVGKSEDLLKTDYSEMTNEEFEETCKMVRFLIHNLMQFVFDGATKKESNPTIWRAAIQIADLANSKLKNCFESVELVPESDVFIDPYENEYCPDELIGAVSIKEDSDSIENLMTALDDDPDAVSMEDADGLPTKYNNTPVELDPLAVKMFRNNGEFLDPPEVKKAVDARSIEPEIEAGSANELTVSDEKVNQLIDVIADGEEEKTDESSSNFSLNDIPGLSLNATPACAKESSDVPPLFNRAHEITSANLNIAENEGNNLKMLSFLLNADI